MKKQTGYEKGLNEIMLWAETVIEEITQNVRSVYRKDANGREGPEPTEATTKVKEINTILQHLPKYLSRHYARTFTQFYNHRYSVRNGKSLIINTENWDSFELTPEEKKEIFNEVFTVPNLLSELISRKAGEIIDSNISLMMNRFNSDNLIEKLDAYGNTKKGNPAEQKTIFPQILIKYCNSEERTTYKRLLKETNYYSEEEISKAEARFKKYVEAFISMAIKILKDNSGNTERTAREAAAIKAFDKLEYHTENIPPSAVIKLGTMIKEKINKKKSQK
jgi:ABC-type transporter MlaC component